jgi:hypothetical protein
VVFANDSQPWVGERVFLYTLIYVYHNQPQARTWAGHHIKYQKIDREKACGISFLLDTFLESIKQEKKSVELRPTPCFVFFLLDVNLRVYHFSYQSPVNQVTFLLFFYIPFGLGFIYIFLSLSLGVRYNKSSRKCFLYNQISFCLIAGFVKLFQISSMILFP